MQTHVVKESLLWKQMIFEKYHNKECPPTQRSICLQVAHKQFLTLSDLDFLSVNNKNS